MLVVKGSKQTLDWHGPFSPRQQWQLEEHDSRVGLCHFFQRISMNNTMASIDLLKVSIIYIVWTYLSRYQWMELTQYAKVKKYLLELVCGPAKINQGFMRDAHTRDY